jgi:phospholipase C
VRELLLRWGGPNNELNQSKTQFFNDCTNNTLPQVSFITEAPPYDEHPPSNIHTGMNMIKSIITTVQASKAWASTAILIYDEAGGFFDHIPPKQLDAYGPGIRVPMTIVPPFAKPRFVDTAYSALVSCYKQLHCSHEFAALGALRRRGAPPPRSICSQPSW